MVWCCVEKIFVDEDEEKSKKGKSEFDLNYFIVSTESKTMSDSHSFNNYDTYLQYYLS